jgi:molybdate transport system substrate-binding protein
MRRGALVVTALALAALGWAPPAGATKDKLSGEVTVFAASSLTDSFKAIARDFKKRYPDVTVKFNFDSSSNLAAQIEQGAPADVFASADDATIQKTIDSGELVPPPVVFAKNRLQVAVERGNPKHIRSLADLARPGLDVVLCADQVPCGKYAAQVLRNAGVTVSPVSKEENAKAALAKVSLGEADAAIVYVTDVTAARGRVAGVRIPDRQNVIATYPAGVLRSRRNAEAAKAWVVFLQEDRTRKTLKRFGFLAP